MTVVETKSATPEDPQPWSVWCFLKKALLKNQQTKKVQRDEPKLNIIDKQLYDRLEKTDLKALDFTRGN